MRIGRFLNVPLGLLLAGVPWFLQGASTGYAINMAVGGLAVVVLAIPRGPKHEHYGLWDRFVR